MSTENTGRECVVPTCRGHIVKETIRKGVGEPIMGPAGNTRFENSTTLYCSRCGIYYHHLPPKK